MQVSKAARLLVFVIFLLSLAISSSAQTIKKLPYLQNASIEKGEALFIANCNKCHEVCNQNLGPALSDVMYKRPINWLVKFIQNSQEVIGSGDPYATHLYESYNAMVMPNYPDLTRDDIINIMAYIDMAAEPSRKDTIIGITTEVSGLINKAADNYDSKQPGEVDYYKNTDEYALMMTQESIKRGKGLFNAQCEQCHAICETKIGPALASISQRRPLPWLMDFIANPTEMVKTGDDYVSFLVTNYSFIMPNFDYLSDTDKLDILAYIRSESSAGSLTTGVNSQMLSEDAIIRQSADDTIQSTDYDSLREDGEMRTLKRTEGTSSAMKILIVLVVGGLIAIIFIAVFRLLKNKKR